MLILAKQGMLKEQTMTGLLCVRRDQRARINAKNPWGGRLLGQDAQ